MTAEQREAPVAALRFAAGPVAFTDGDADKPTEPVAISMIARSAQPLDHWYWGRIVHDMGGMQPHGDRIPADYCHGEECGYLDRFDVDDEQNLVVSGKLVPTTASDDIARKIIERNRGGVPYEASIFFDPRALVLEEVGEGFGVDVNGYTFEGPGVVVRKWLLRAVAVCPHGYDRDTSSKVDELGLFTAPVTRRGPPVGNTAAMSKTSTPGDSQPKPKDDKAELTEGDGATPEQTPPKESAELSGGDQPKGGGDAPDPTRVELSRFMEAFGDEQGATWFRDGLSFEAAQAKFTKTLREENAELKQRLSGANAADDEGAGEEKPVGFSGGHGDETKTSLADFCQVGRGGGK